MALGSTAAVSVAVVAGERVALDAGVDVVYRAVGIRGGIVAFVGVVESTVLGGTSGSVAGAATLGVGMLWAARV
jgi:hypothetical protein